MKPISFYIIFTVFSCLVFLVAAYGFERYRKPISSLLAEKFPFLRKVPWDTLIRGLAAAGVILLLKKFLYIISSYKFLSGIIQTPTSVWWVELKVLIIFFCFFFLFLTAMVKIIKDHKKLRYFF